MTLMPPSGHDAIRYREASSADVPAMERSRRADRDSGPADERMVAYLEGRHHPQQALAPRTAFIALDGDAVVGYIVGHATTRFGCDGEVQHLYVTPQCRRRGVAAELLRRMAGWFSARGIARVCVDVDIDSPAAVPTYVALGAVPLDRYWYVWEDITALISPADALPPVEPPMTHTLEHVFGYRGDAMHLPVPNLTAAIPFYETVLGFRVVTRGETPFPHAILARDQVQIGLEENGGDPTQDGAAFHVRGVHALFGAFAMNGLTTSPADFSTEMRDGVPWTVGYVVAPDGLCFWFGERAT
jgi:ribosomal protein S18 acetylase RimI-like enzyme